MAEMTWLDRSDSELRRRLADLKMEILVLEAHHDRIVEEMRERRQNRKARNQDGLPYVRVTAPESKPH